MQGFKPMLAAEANLERLKFPLYASPKLDGVRATFIDGRLLTRSLKPIPNQHVNQLFRFNKSLDGELIVGEAYAKDVFRETMKVVSAHTVVPENLTFRVFDWVNPELPFWYRFQLACDLCEYKWMIPVPHTMLHSLDELMKYEDEMVKVGYEGIMLRDPKGKYKFGRSTENEGLLLKLKRLVRSEAKVIAFDEQMHNANELKTDNLGYAERSSHLANMVPMGTLGALVVTDLGTGVTFNIGTGFTAAERQDIWNRREHFLGAVASYDYQPVGVKDKPRHPRFKGWRMKEDM